MSEDFKHNTPPSLTASSLIRSFQLEGAGLQRILGSLEAELLDTIWRLTPDAQDQPSGWTTIGQVCAALGPTYNYKTVQTVMNRLVEKRLLARRERLRAYEYRPVVTRDALVATVTRSIIDGLVHDFGDIAVAQLLRTLHTVSPAHLAELEALTRASDEAPVSPRPSSDDSSQWRVDEVVNEGAMDENVDENNE